ncbi:MAG TPA: hypothetical protein VMT22_02045 [Terriglobales bacterium]|nr:hypothetical protein [Terriglobales bacterium]
MYVSRLTFHTLPGKTHEVEERLKTLLIWVTNAGGLNPRVMRTHYGSLGAPDLIFEQEVQDPGALEAQIKKVTENKDFEPWAKQVSGLLEQSSKRELYEITAPAHETRDASASLIIGMRLGIEDR